ncbi:cob(I)yrinic acid a,c-diamide adenosyltransferase, partial [Fusobacterium sp.]
SGEYDIIIADEIIGTLKFDLISIDEIKFLIKNKPNHVELILTGRNAPEELIELADLVTEMREVKHYFQKGVYARVGIEK